MNSKSEVADLENFLQRMFWTTRGLCRPYGADFFKWTGDGFVAWFPVELDRERGEIATAAIDAASHLSSLIYATQLALKPATPFQIRHGMAYEKGGLVFEITTPEGEVERDLLGRDIVLAFRLSGVASPFPFICAHRDVALDSNPNATFRALTLTDEEITKYMKGERYGCDALYQTIDDRGVELSKEKLEQIRGGILRAKERMEAGDQPDPKDPYNQWCEYMQSSGAPNWSKEIMRKYDDSLREVTTRLMGEV